MKDDKDPAGTFMERVSSSLQRGMSSRAREYLSGAVEFSPDGMARIDMMLLYVAAALLGEDEERDTESMLTLLLSLLFPSLSFTDDEAALLGFLSSEYDESTHPYDFVDFAIGDDINLPSALGGLMEKGFVLLDEEDIILMREYIYLSDE